MVLTPIRREFGGTLTNRISQILIKPHFKVRLFFVKFALMKTHLKSITFASIVLTMVLAGCCRSNKIEETKAWAWLGTRAAESDSLLEHYFRNAAEAGIDAVFYEAHGGYPVIVDSTTFTDLSAVENLKRAATFAKKYGVELHAWMWTTNRCEKTLLKAHPEWYQVTAKGESLAEIKMYNREHYRFLCPNHEGVLEYMKERVRELAQVDGLAGIHMDFIRYPDAMLPYALHESRGVVQDKIYPEWDCCYCDECRAKFKAQTGIDPLDLEDPTSNEEWMQFRYDTMAKFASEIAAEIKACGKISSAAVFASPAESKKLVRQDWVNFRNVDFLMPMIYNKSYGFPDEWIEVATREGIEGLKSADNPAVLLSGLSMGGRRMAERADSLKACASYAMAGGSPGVCIFCLDSFNRAEDGWAVLKELVESIKQK